MVGVGTVCGLLIVTVFQVTLPAINRNKAEALERAIFHVLPQATSSTTFRYVDNEGFQRMEADALEATSNLVYAGYDGAGELAGLAVEAQGMGYQDVVRILYGYSFEGNAVVGIRVLESRETPGLGDRIETDTEFLANFRQLDVSLIDDGSRIANVIVPVKHGTKEYPWQVDAITGATISSNAIANILGASTVRWVPLIGKHRADFERGGGS
jgi:electron transport complex protein RnfG